MDEEYFQYIHRLAIGSPTFRKWRNLQDGERYIYNKIIYNKPEDEEKLLKALRGASVRHHCRQEKKGLPWGIRSRHPFSYNGMSTLPAVMIKGGNKAHAKSASDPDAAVTHPNAMDILVKCVEMRVGKEMVKGVNRIATMATDVPADDKLGRNESGGEEGGEVAVAVAAGRGEEEEGDDQVAMIVTDVPTDNKAPTNSNRFDVLKEAMETVVMSKLGRNEEEEEVAVAAARGEEESPAVDVVKEIRRAEAMSKGAKGQVQNIMAVIKAEGMFVNQMLGDGNCLFRSLSDQIYNDGGENHKLVRNNVCNQLSKNTESIRDFFTDDINISEYIEKMRKDKVWGDDQEIAAAAKHYGRTITIFHDEFPNSRYSTGDCSSNEPPLMLVYTGRKHYDSVIDHANFFELPSSSNEDKVNDNDIIDSVAKSSSSRLRKYVYDRLPIAKRTRSGAKSTRSGAKEIVLTDAQKAHVLTYPFPANEKDLSAAASGLKELGGDLLGLDHDHGPEGEGDVVKVHEARACNDEEDVTVSFADDDSPADNNVFVGLTMTLAPRPSEVRDNPEDDGGSDTDDDSPAPLPNAVIAKVQAVCEKPASKQGETQQPVPLVGGEPRDREDTPKTEKAAHEKETMVEESLARNRESQSKKLEGELVFAKEKKDKLRISNMVLEQQLKHLTDQNELLKKQVQKAIVVPTTTLAPGPSKDGDDEGDGTVSSMAFLHPERKGEIVYANKAHAHDDGDNAGLVEENMTAQAPVVIKTVVEKNGISFRNECHRECFSSSTKNCCSKIKHVPLNNIGDYVRFHADTLHRGFFMASNDILVTAQLFCGYKNDSGKSMRSNSMSMSGIFPGRIDVSPELSMSVCTNWDSDYPKDNFSPPKQFQLSEVDLRQNRYIKSTHFEECKHLGNLVKQFMLVFPFLNVEAVWLIRKKNEGDGFQEWHRDMVKNATIAYTIVVNLGAVEERESILDERFEKRKREVGMKKAIREK